MKRTYNNYLWRNFDEILTPVGLSLTLSLMFFIYVIHNPQSLKGGNGEVGEVGGKFVDAVSS